MRGASRAVRPTTESLTRLRLRTGGQLAKTLSSMNPFESMVEIVGHTQRNGTQLQDGDIRKRWTAVVLLAAEQQFRRIVGYRDLAKLVIAIERPASAATPTPCPSPPDGMPGLLACYVRPAAALPQLGVNLWPIRRPGARLSSGRRL